MMHKPKSFCFFFSLQVGVVFICLCGLVLHTIAILKLLLNGSPETTLSYLVASYLFASLFIIAGFVPYVIGLIGSSLENPRLVKIAGWFLVIEFLIWLPLTALSFFGSCTLSRLFCVDNRCGEKLFIQNGYWRTSLTNCEEDSYAWPWDTGWVTGFTTIVVDIYNAPSVTTEGPQKNGSRRLPVSVRPDNDRNGTLDRLANASGPSYRNIHSRRNKESKDKQIISLLESLKYLIGDLREVMEPKPCSLAHMDKQSMRNQYNRSSECADNTSCTENSTFNTTDIAKPLKKPGNESDAHKSGLLALNHNIPLWKNDSESTFLMTVKNESKEEHVNWSNLSLTIQPLTRNTEQKYLFTKNYHHRHRRAGGSCPGIPFRHADVKSFEDIDDHQSEQLPWGPSTLLVDARVFPREALLTTAWQNNSSTAEAMRNGSSQNAPQDRNSGVTGNVSHSEPFGGNKTTTSIFQSTIRAIQLRQGTYSNKPVGRYLQENTQPASQPNNITSSTTRKPVRGSSKKERWEGSKKYTTIRRAKTGQRVGSNGTTVGYRNTATRIANTSGRGNATKSYNHTRVGTVHSGPEWRRRVVLGPWTPLGFVGTLPHFIVSLIYAFIVLGLWYIYPILLFFGFAEELIAEQQDVYDSEETSF